MHLLEKNEIKIDTEISSLKKDFEKKGIKNVEITKINKGIYAVSMNKKNINSYIDSNGEVIFNLQALSELSKILNNKPLAILGVVEIKNKDGEYEMFKVKSGGFDEKGEFKGEVGEKIDKYSMAYLKIWQDIYFLNGELGIILLINKNSEGKYIKGITEGNIEAFIDSKTIRIKDLIQFYQQKQISGQMLLKCLPQVKKLLKEQIWDYRFSKVYDPGTGTTSEVTRKELEMYKSIRINGKKFITDKEYQNYIKELEEFEKTKKKLEEKVKTEIKPKLNNLEKGISK